MTAVSLQLFDTRFRSRTHDFLSGFRRDIANEFAKQLGPTPLSRPGWPGIIRNACIAAGNSGDISYLDTLERLTSNTDPIVSDAARWAIEQITRAAQNQSPR